MHLVACSLYHAVAGLYVDIAFGCQSPNHYAFCSQLAGHLYVVDHTVHLVLGIHEVALPGSDKNMYVYAAVHSQLNHTGRRGNPVYIKGLAQFYSVCSASYGSTKAMRIGTAYL